MGNIAIIPARGGSKRIPRKNIKEFCGHPIMSYPIRTALNSGLFDEVMVSTDDEEIAAIARQYGASVPFMRSEATANDYAGMMDVIQEVLREYEKLGKHFDYAFCLYAASPFCTTEMLHGMMKQMQDNREISNTTVMIPYNFAPLKARYFDERGSVVCMFPEYFPTRTQDLTPCYNDGAIAFGGVADMYAGKIDWYGIGAGYVVHPMYAQDVDNQEDWEMMEFKYQYLKSKGKV